MKPVEIALGFLAGVLAGADKLARVAASSAVFDYIETFYNRSRRHGALGFRSPHAFLENYFQNLNPSLN